MLTIGSIYSVQTNTSTLLPSMLMQQSAPVLLRTRQLLPLHEHGPLAPLTEGAFQSLADSSVNCTPTQPGCQAAYHEVSAHNPQSLPPRR